MEFHQYHTRLWRFPHPYDILQISIHICEPMRYRISIDYIYKAEKINPMSQSCRAYLFFGAGLF